MCAIKIECQRIADRGVIEVVNFVKLGGIYFHFILVDVRLQIIHAESAFDIDIDLVGEGDQLKPNRGAQLVNTGLTIFLPRPRTLVSG